MTLPKPPAGPNQAGHRPAEAEHQQDVDDVHRPLRPSFGAEKRRRAAIKEVQCLPRCASRRHQGGAAGCCVQAWPATMLTLRAMTMTLKKNARTLCTRTTRRMLRALTCTSDTWKVMPITKAKYTKSQ